MALPTCNFGAISNFSLAYTDINCFGFSVATAGDLSSCEFVCDTSSTSLNSSASLPADLAVQRSGASRQTVSTCDYVCQEVRAHSSEPVVGGIKLVGLVGCQHK